MNFHELTIAIERIQSQIRANFGLPIYKRINVVCDGSSDHGLAGALLFKQVSIPKGYFIERILAFATDVTTTDANTYITAGDLVYGNNYIFSNVTGNVINWQTAGPNIQSSRFFVNNQDNNFVDFQVSGGSITAGTLNFIVVLNRFKAL